MNQKLNARLTNFARMISDPLGNIPFDRAVQNELELFIDMRAKGYTWEQIASGLAKAGLRRSDGNIFSAPHIRSSISRQIRRNNTAQEAVIDKQIKLNTPSPKATPKADADPLPSSNVDTIKTLQNNDLIKSKLTRTRLLRES